MNKIPPKVKERPRKFRKVTFQMTKQTKLRKYNNNNNRCQNVRKIFTVRALLTLKICSKSSSIRGVVILRVPRPSNFWPELRWSYKEQ